MSNVKISELETTSAVSTSDLMETAIPSGNNYASKKMSIAQLATYLENSVVHSALDTQNKTIIDAINELKSICDNLSASHFIVTNQLPTSDINMNAIYLIPKQSTGVNDVYEEYICLDDTTTPATWEKIGETQIDLSNYISFDDADIATTSKNGSMSKADRSKMNGIESGAQKNVQSDWNASSGDALILNKPTIPTVNNNTISITQNGTVVDSFTLNQNSNKTIEVKDEKVKQTEITDDRVMKSLAIASDNTTTTDTDGVEKCNGLAMKIKKHSRPDAVHQVELCIGNDIAVGSTDNYVGVIRMFGTHEYSTLIHAGNSTDEREIVFPDADGTLALQSDLPTNPVLWAQNNLLGAKNLITFPYYHGFSRTTNNVVFTVDNDGIITVGGTQASANASFYLMYNVKLPNGTYTLSDGGVGTADTYLSCVYYTSPTASASYYDVATSGSVTFTVNDWDRAIIRIWSRNGKTADNLVFKPMLRLASISDDTWEPYAETNYKLTTGKVNWSDANILGSKNLLDGRRHFTRTNKTVVGTYNYEDGTATLNGTANADGAMFNQVLYVRIPNVKVGDRLILSMEVISGTFTHTSSSNTSLYLNNYESGTQLDGISIKFPNSLSVGDKLFAVYEVKSTMFLDGMFTIRGCQIYMRNNDVFDNFKIAIMLRPANVYDDTFEMYAMTNRQITLDKFDCSSVATIEYSDTASRAYAVNEFMIWRDGFYRVKSAIASGDTIATGNSGNVEVTTLSAQLRQIRDALGI